jgi:hypothetical protein
MITYFITYGFLKLIAFESGEGGNYPPDCSSILSLKILQMRPFATRDFTNQQFGFGVKILDKINNIKV